MIAPIVASETTRSTSGAQYGSTAEAREKNTSSVPSNSAASTPKPMPRRPRAWPSPFVQRDEHDARERGARPASCRGDGRSPRTRP